MSCEKTEYSGLCIGIILVVSAFIYHRSIYGWLKIVTCATLHVISESRSYSINLRCDMKFDSTKKNKVVLPDVKSIMWRIYPRTHDTRKKFLRVTWCNLSYIFEWSLLWSLETSFIIKVGLLYKRLTA